MCCKETDTGKDYSKSSVYHYSTQLLVSLHARHHLRLLSSFFLLLKAFTLHTNNESRTKRHGNRNGSPPTKRLSTDRRERERKGENDPLSFHSFSTFYFSLSLTTTLPLVVPDKWRSFCATRVVGVSLLLLLPLHTKRKRRGNQASRDWWQRARVWKAAVW